MLLKKWDELPDFMRNEEVKPYYDVLKTKKFQLKVKRLFDIVCSLFLIILLSTILIVVAIWIKIDSRGPIFYRQERVTQYGEIFRIIKFRTMVVNADQMGTLVTIQNDSRITKVGEKIRKCRIDEIPQLFNVFLGDMTFVGTRPEVKKYVDAYTNEMYATLLLPAGVTSLASIMFKDEDAFFSLHDKKNKTIDDVYVNEILPIKMEYNLKGVSSFYFIDDIKIMFNTVMRV